MAPDGAGWRRMAMGQAQASAFISLLPTVLGHLSALKSVTCARAAEAKVRSPAVQLRVKGPGPGPQVLCSVLKGVL